MSREQTTQRPNPDVSRRQRPAARMLTSAIGSMNFQAKFIS